MERKAISNSSQIKEVGYDKEKQILEIEFVRGAIYQYDGVPFEIYNTLIHSVSVGIYFNENIRNVYNYRRMY